MGAFWRENFVGAFWREHFLGSILAGKFWREHISLAASLKSHTKGCIRNVLVKYSKCYNIYSFCLYIDGVYLKDIPNQLNFRLL